MLKKLRTNKKGTAEIIGTVMFLIILLFFFGNVFLWHDQVSRQTNQYLADKMNSNIKIEKTVNKSSFLGNGAHNLFESNASTLGYQLNDQPNVQFSTFFPISTSINTSQKLLIETLSITINARYTEETGQTEVCYVYINSTDGWVNTNLVVTDSYALLEKSYSEPYKFINGTGYVNIKFVDSIRQQDQKRGYLDVNSISVEIQSVQLQISNTGGLETALSRLWIIEMDNGNHMYVDLESIPIVNRTVRHESLTIIFREDESGLIRVVNDERVAHQLILFNYVPEGQVAFKILSMMGNTASYDFP